MHNDKLTPTDLLAHRAYLSRGTNEMLELIGAETTAAVLNAYSGQVLFLAKGVSAAGKKRVQQIADTIGRQNAEKLIAVYGGQRQIHVSANHALHRHLRNRRIIAEFDRLTTGSQAITGVAAANLLAQQYRVSARLVHKICSEYEQP